MLDVLLGVGALVVVGYGLYSELSNNKDATTINNKKRSKRIDINFKQLHKIDNLHELAAKTSKEIESMLKSRYNASGKGLHELLNSVEESLDKRTIRILRKIATLRNKVIHEDSRININEFKGLLIELEATEY